MGSAVVLLGAFCSLVRPVKASFLGFLLMAVSIYTSKPAGACVSSLCTVFERDVISHEHLHIDLFTPQASWRPSPSCSS